MDMQNLRCCLASNYLVSRICSNCPGHLFKVSHELFGGIVGLSSRSWRLTDLITKLPDFVHSSYSVTIDPNDEYNELLKRVLNLKFKHICLVCIKMLCTHPDSLVNASFIKVLTPQVGER